MAKETAVRLGHALIQYGYALEKMSVALGDLRTSLTDSFECYQSVISLLQEAQVEMTSDEEAVLIRSAEWYSNTAKSLVATFSEGDCLNVAAEIKHMLARAGFSV